MLNDGDNMRIGKFAEYNKVTKDTIRHYMDMGLIIPEKKSGKYHFNERCQKNLEQVLALKSMDFSLNDIKNIFRMQLLGKYSDYEKDEYYRKLFLDKRKTVEEQIVYYTNVKGRLNNEIKKIALTRNKTDNIIGINIECLEMFTCLKCRSDLILYDGRVNNNQIIEGKLRCKCGEEYIIKDGILITDDNMVNYYDEDQYCISDFINNTDTEFINNLYKGIESWHQKIKWSDFSNKVILELGTGYGFVLRNILDDLSDDTIYIAVDHDLTMQKYLKKMLESANCSKNIIFLCCDFSHIPIKNESVDILMDITGTSNYSFNDTRFLLEIIDRYVKKEAYLMGAYILFKNFSERSSIDKTYRKNFMIDNIIKGINDLGYKKITEDYIYDYIKKADKYENYFTKGEKVYLYTFHGKR
ncbi:MerR family transcriptional regulator [Vallitalea longa]|uniref:MerR family transcriptional regulator n=1 Tax=Vallitalea longa TaxID=2936439 RepID=A0A9W5YAU6_9FIRM|nr:MerR family transcriptional regulator [Vallitalea longa]GKX29225.1 MerR family transcriptional regulator [Vallitalea longa]